MPLHAKQRIKVEHLYKNNSAMVCYRAIPYADNKLKKSPYVIVCTQNLHQRTTMIKEIYLYTFWENISNRI